MLSRGFRTRRGLLALVTAVSLLLCATVHAGSEEERRGSLLVQAAGMHHQQLTIYSEEQEKLLWAEVLGWVDHPFEEVAGVLTRPAAWCEFVPLHLNVKACTWREAEGAATINLYVGRKFFQTPEESSQLSYRFQVPALSDDHFQVFLSARQGLFGTRDYHFELEGVPIEGRTFLRFRLVGRPSRASRLATRAYLATIGRDKVGFSVVVAGEKPVYVDGLRGIIERNAMRYYLALKAFLQTRGLPPGDLFEARLLLWYDLTEDYPLQLHELERREYLENKRQEWWEQERLQAGGDPPVR